MGRYAPVTSISRLMPGFLVGNTTASDTAGVDIWSIASDDAEAEVNSSLVARYDASAWTSTGSPAIPPLVRKMANDLSCLYTIRRSQVQDSQIKNPNIAEWERTQDILEQIESGERRLAYTDGSLVPTRSGSRILSSTEDYAHIFALDDESNWDVDDDLIDDVDSERA